MCSFATQLVCKMLNLTFKNNIWGCVEWWPGHSVFMFFFLSQEERPAYKACLPFNLAVGHFQPSVNRLDVHKCVCIHLRVTDTILKITCTSIFENIFLFIFSDFNYFFLWIINVNNLAAFQLNLQFSAFYALVYCTHLYLCISAKVEMLAAAPLQRVCVCVSVPVPVYTFGSMLFELSGSQTFNHREKIECSLSSTVRVGGSFYWKTPPSLSCLLIYLQPSILMLLTCIIIGVFHNDSSGMHRFSQHGMVAMPSKSLQLRPQYWVINIIIIIII